MHKFEGTTESAKINMIIRDFTKEGMEKRLKVIEKLCLYSMTVTVKVECP